jgi:microcystin-dependent protein
MTQQMKLTDPSPAIITMPVGSVISFAGVVPPAGWLLCNGQSIADEKYKELSTLLNAKNVPDLRSRFIIGAGQGPGLSNRNLKDAGGEENHTLTSSEIPSHSHNFGVGGGGGDSSSGKTGTDQGYSKNYANCSFKNKTGSTGGGGAHNNMPPFYTLSYIIRF